ncbi:hypothetical protein, partial [Clostridium perfringens]
TREFAPIYYRIVYTVLNLGKIPYDHPEGIDESKDLFVRFGPAGLGARAANPTPTKKQNI